jgi:hypothetical protein
VETLGYRGNRVKKEFQEHLGIQDLKELQERRDILETWENPVSRDNQGKMENREHLDPSGFQVIKE